MERKSKTVFQIETPFPIVKWPKISQHDQEAVLELLCSVLSPIGQHRLNHITPSKGKRSRKRKRDIAKLSTDNPKLGAEFVSISTSPAAPGVSPFVVVGFNNICRVLESLSKSTKPEPPQNGNDGKSIALNESNQDSEAHMSGVGSQQNEPGLGRSPKYYEAFAETAAHNKFPRDPNETQPLNHHFSSIFVVSSISPALESHLPALVAAASLAAPHLPPTRLIALPAAASARLSSVLSLQRVSCIGILEAAPDCQTLIDMVQKLVPGLEMSWLQKANCVDLGRYLPCKFGTLNTFVGEKKVKINAR